MKSSSRLAVDQLKVGYNNQVVAEIANLEMEADEVIAIIGPSGSGKSTFLATLAGAQPSISGTIAFDGAHRNMEWMLRNVSRTLPNFPLLHWLTVKQNLFLSAKMRNCACDNLDDLLASVHARHLAAKYPHTLSSGERCRASLAQAFVSRPVLLLLDEPFGALDVVIKEQVAESLFELVRNRRVPALFVTHDLFDACAYSHRIIVFGNGSPTKVEATFSSDEPHLYERLFEIMGGKRHAR